MCSKSDEHCLKDMDSRLRGNDIDTVLHSLLSID
jgi:hypothetical protein